MELSQHPAMLEMQDSDAGLISSRSSSNLSPFAPPFMPRDHGGDLQFMSIAVCNNREHGRGRSEFTSSLHTSSSTVSLPAMEVDLTTGQDKGLSHSRSYPAGLENVGDSSGNGGDKTRCNRLDSYRSDSIGHSLAGLNLNNGKTDGPVVRILQRAGEEFRDEHDKHKNRRIELHDGEDATSDQSSYLLMLSERLPLPSSDLSTPVGFEREQKRRQNAENSSGSSSKGRTRKSSESFVASSTVNSEHSCNSSEKEYDLFDGLRLWKVGDGKTAGGWDVLGNDIQNLGEEFGPFGSRSESRLLKLMQGSIPTSGPPLLTRSASYSNEGADVCRPRLFRTASAPEGESTVGFRPANMFESLRPTWSCSSLFELGQLFYRNPDEIQLEVDDENCSEYAEAENENHSDGDNTLLAADLPKDENGNSVDGSQAQQQFCCSTSSEFKLPLDINGNIFEDGQDDEAKWYTRTAHWKWNDHDVMPLIERSKLRSNDSGFASLTSTRSEASLEVSSSVVPDIAPQKVCPRHDNEILTLYCTDCCQTLCPLCFTSEHMDCGRVVTTTMACHDLKWQLLKLQSNVGSGIARLETRVKQLTPNRGEVTKMKEEAKQNLKEHLDKTIEDATYHYQELLKELDDVYQMKEKQTEVYVKKTEKSLLLLHYVSKFLEVLRQRDSGWDLLATFDNRLNKLLQSVLRKATSSLDSPLALDEGEDELQVPLINCKKTALSLAWDVLECVDNGSTLEQSSAGGYSLDMPAVRDSLFTSEWGSTWTPTYNSEVDDSGWESFIKANAFQVQDGDSRGPSSEGSESGAFSTVATSSPKCLSEDEGEKDEDALIREILSYMQRFPPPSTGMPGVPGSKWYLYDTIDTPSLLLSASELIDDVFQFDETHVRRRLHEEDPASVFTSHHAEVTSEFRLQERLAIQFPEDCQVAFITDLHVTETGRLLFVDAANHCLKRLDLRHPPYCPPARLHVPSPLALCSAGWERVMVSCAGRTLGLYSVGGFGPLRPLATRSTRQQYRGLVRASDALVAAASPETRSVDLLDLGGRVLRSIIPVDFVRGPEVVGKVRTGELLVVHQPANPPTILICFDMGGHVIWEHEMRTRSRHVSCSKVVGGEDGCVYYALQGDSAVYRLDPETGTEVVLLNSRSGIKFPSSLTVDADERVLVTRNELPSLQPMAVNQIMLPSTSEVDIFIQDNSRVSG